MNLPRMVEWHVAEPEAATRIAKMVHDMDIPNIKVIYTPARTL